MNNLIPPSSHPHFIVNSTLHSYNTRNMDNLHINYCPDQAKTKHCKLARTKTV